MHLPLTDESLPAQKNLWQRLSISALAQGGRFSAIMAYIGTTCRTDLIHTKRPLLAISAPWQGGILRATASTTDW